MSKKNKAPVRLLSRADLRDRGITYSPTYLREMWTKGLFPRPQKLSPHKLVWYASEIDAWVAKRLKQSSSA